MLGCCVGFALICLRDSSCGYSRGKLQQTNPHIFMHFSQHCLKHLFILFNRLFTQLFATCFTTSFLHTFTQSFSQLFSSANCSKRTLQNSQGVAQIRPIFQTNKNGWESAKKGSDRALGQPKKRAPPRRSQRRPREAAWTTPEAETHAGRAKQKSKKYPKIPSAPGPT